MYDSHLFFTRLVNTLLTQDVRAMGRKWDGLEGSSVAFALPSRCTMPTFQAAGTDWVDQQQLKRCSSAGSNEGHFLKTRYGTWSAGLGADEDLRPEMTALSSSSVNGAVDMGMEGGGQSGIHSGREKVLGVAE